MVESLKSRLKVIFSCHVSSTILVVGLVMEYLYPACNQVLKILADFVVGLGSRLCIILSCHGSAIVLVIGPFLLFGCQNFRILASSCGNSEM